jgi:hypothetical protein
MIMGVLAWIFGLLGGLCMVMGVVTAAEVVPLLGAEYTWTFWFMLSGVLLLICIAFITGRTVTE